MNEIITAAAEMCPYCMSENVFANWDVETQGYEAVCWQCGKKIMLCDECFHAEDNPHGKCDWHEVLRAGKSDGGDCCRKRHERP